MKGREGAIRAEQALDALYHSEGAGRPVVTYAFFAACLLVTLPSLVFPELMSTTVHLPPDLLASVDHRAQELGLSRNRYIIRALKSALESETRWSSEFVEEMEAAQADEESRQILKEMRKDIVSKRTRKGPPAL